MRMSRWLPISMRTRAAILAGLRGPSPRDSTTRGLCGRRCVERRQLARPSSCGCEEVRLDGRRRAACPGSSAEADAGARTVRRRDHGRSSLASADRRASTRWPSPRSVGDSASSSPSSRNCGPQALRVGGAAELAASRNRAAGRDRGRARPRAALGVGMDRLAEAGFRAARSRRCGRAHITAMRSAM